MKPDPQTITFTASVKRQSEAHEAALTAVIEYDCQDCGAHVYAFGRPPVPGKDRCAGCQWIAAIPDPAHRAALRSQLGHIGPGP